MAQPPQFVAHEKKKNMDYNFHSLNKQSLQDCCYWCDRKTCAKNALVKLTVQ